eukprot:s199_g8.t1
MYMASLYGPTVAFKYADPVALMNRIFNQAATRGLHFQGPAAIVGDFNVTLEKLDAWPVLCQAGWVDAAQLSAVKNNHQLDNTSCDAVRHSFVLVNPDLARSLQQCRTCYPHMFSTHPVLKATFSIKTICSPVRRWTLPRSFDAFLADPQIAEEKAKALLLQSQKKWESAMNNGDIDELARKWTNTIKDAYAAWYQTNEQTVLKAKQAIQKLDLIEDWHKGGKVAFSKVKTCDLMPLTFIKSTIECPIKRVCWTKDGRDFLPCNDPEKLDPNLPVLFQTQTAAIRGVLSNGIKLDRKVHLLSYQTKDLILRQEQTHMCPEDMHDQLFSAWNTLFQRDDPEEIDHVSSEMCHLVDKIPQHQIAAMPQITCENIQVALQATKVSSSRGSDGFSTLDLRKVQCEIPANDGRDHQVFTDGSAFFNDIPSLSIAAGAYVEVGYPKQEILSHKSHIVPGCEQHSFAGELFAVLLALNSFFHLHIYSDCQTVVDLLEDEIHGRPRRHDLSGCRKIWHAISEHIRSDFSRRIEITKVKAHVTAMYSMDTFEKWTAWCNNAVDRTAKATVTDHNRGVFLKLEALHKKASQQRRDAREFFAFVSNASERCIKASGEWQKSRQRQVTLNIDIPELAEPTQTQSMRISVTHEQYKAFPWGPVFLWRIVQWANQLKWPVNPDNTSTDISLLELYVDYLITTGTRALRNVFTKAQRDKYTAPCYILDDLSDRADVQATTLGYQSQVWSKCLSWLHKHSPGVFFPVQLTKKSVSLNKLGCSATYKGFKPRPRLVHGPEVIQKLHSFFNTESGYNRHLNRVMDVPQKAKPVHPVELDIPFHDRSKAIREAVRIFAAAN